MPTTSTPLTGFPDAASAGARDGVALARRDGDMTVTTPGAVLSGFELHGTLRIEADRVTVRDCRIVNTNDHNIIIPQPYRATVEYCDLIGGRNGISGAGTFRFNDFSGNENGVNVYGPSLIHDNYIHDLAGGPEAHFDGVENNGASDMVVRHNTIVNDHGWTSAIMINNEFGKIDRIVVKDNYLAGGAYTIYVDGRKKPSNTIKNVEISGNHIGKGAFGYYSFTGSKPKVLGNRELGLSWPTPRSAPSPDAGAAPLPGARQPSKPASPSDSGTQKRSGRECVASTESGVPAARGCSQSMLLGGRPPDRDGIHPYDPTLGLVFLPLVWIFARRLNLHAFGPSNRSGLPPKR